MFRINRYILTYGREEVAIPLRVTQGAQVIHVGTVKNRQGGVAFAVWMKENDDVKMKAVHRFTIRKTGDATPSSPYIRSVEIGPSMYHVFDLGEDRKGEEELTTSPIVVDVSGGVVQGISNIPPGMVIEVHDYDVGDITSNTVQAAHEENFKTDEDGETYHLGVWKSLWKN